MQLDHSRPTVVPWLEVPSPWNGAIKLQGCKPAIGGQTTSNQIDHVVHVFQNHLKKLNETGQAPFLGPCPETRLEHGEGCAFQSAKRRIHCPLPIFTRYITDHNCGLVPFTNYDQFYQFYRHCFDSNHNCIPWKHHSLSVIPFTLW